MKNILSIIIILVIIGWIFKDCGGGSSSNSSNSSESPSSESSVSHTCTQCGTTYSGYGWRTIGGEQYQPSSDEGDQCCSKSCAFDSQPNKWK